MGGRESKKSCPVHMEIGANCKFCIDNEHVVNVPALLPEIRRINTSRERVSIIGAYRRVIAVLADHINETQDSSSTLKIRRGDTTEPSATLPM